MSEYGDKIMTIQEWAERYYTPLPDVVIIGYTIDDARKVLRRRIEPGDDTDPRIE